MGDRRSDRSVVNQSELHSLKVVFDTLRSFESVTADELAQHLGSTDVRGITDSLQSLCQIGAVRPSISSPTEYAALDIRSIFPALAEELISDFNSKFQLFAEISREFTIERILDNPPENKECGNSNEIVKGKEAAVNRLHEITALADSSLFVYIPYKPSHKQIETAMASDIEFANRRVDTRILYSPIADGLTEISEYARKFSNSTLNVRVSTNLKPELRITLVDKRIAYLRRTGDHPGDYALITENPEVVALALEMFEYMWIHSRAFQTANDSKDREPSARDLVILRLLAQGRTIDSIAKELEVNRRTVDRALERLESMVDAHSRFDFGVKVQRLGWLDD